MNVPVLVYQSIVQFAGGMADNTAEVTLLHAVTFPPELGADGSALTVIVAGCVDAHPVVGFVAATV
jgi:hypothetical protein